MRKFSALLVIASAAIANGFVKGGYTASNPGSSSLTFVNRGPATVLRRSAGPRVSLVGSSSNPTVSLVESSSTPTVSPVENSPSPAVSLNLNGAHTLAGEVIVHHVIYHGNVAPVVYPSVPLGPSTFNRGFTQVVQLHGNGRTQNSAPLALPPPRQEYLAPYLAAHGLQESRRIPDVHISPPAPVYQIAEQRLPGINSGAIYPQPLIYSQQPLKPQVQSQQQQRQQSQIQQISQVQQRPVSSIPHQISQHLQQNNQMSFHQQTRKPMNELNLMDPSIGSGERSQRLPGMPTLAEITSQLSGMNGGTSKPLGV